MADPRRAELYATLARSTAAAAAALGEQARAFAALAELEAGEAGVGVDAGGAEPANDAVPVVVALPVPKSKPKAPRKRAARPIPAPDPTVKVDEVTRARAKRILRGMGIVS